LRAARGRRGEPLAVPIAGRNARRVIFGAINIDTGRRRFLARTRQRGEGFRAFLPLVASHDRGWHVALVLDEDSSHTAQASQDLARQLGMKLLWPPQRCPELNGRDHLWGHGKGHMSAHKQYATIEGQAERFIRYLTGLPNRGALRQAGILSENFWLRV
jgi:hypothetical protein